MTTSSPGPVAIPASDSDSESLLPYYSIRGERHLLPIMPESLESWSLDDTLSDQNRMVVNHLQKVLATIVVSVNVCASSTSEVCTTRERLLES